jgi:hypothetical protein
VSTILHPPPRPHSIPVGRFYRTHKRLRSNDFIERALSARVIRRRSTKQGQPKPPNSISASISASFNGSRVHCYSRTWTRRRTACILLTESPDEGVSRPDCVNMAISAGLCPRRSDTLPPPQPAHCRDGWRPDPSNYRILSDLGPPTAIIVAHFGKSVL